MYYHCYITLCVWQFSPCRQLVSTTNCTRTQNLTVFFHMLCNPLPNQAMLSHLWLTTLHVFSRLGSTFLQPAPHVHTWGQQVATAGDTGPTAREGRPRGRCHQTHDGAVWWLSRTWPQVSSWLLLGHMLVLQHFESSDTWWCLVAVTDIVQGILMANPRDISSGIFMNTPSPRDMVSGVLVANPLRTQSQVYWWLILRKLSKVYWWFILGT